MELDKKEKLSCSFYIFETLLISDSSHTAIRIAEPWTWGQWIVWCCFLPPDIWLWHITLLDGRHDRKLAEDFLQQHSG